jgi:hypothetical protein
MHRPATSSSPLNRADFRALGLLKLGAFELRNGAWRFGTRKVGDSIVSRLLAHRRAIEPVPGRVVLAANPKGGR